MTNRVQYITLEQYRVVEIAWDTNEILQVIAGPFESAEAASVAKPDNYCYKVVRITQSVAAELLED